MTTQNSINNTIGGAGTTTVLAHARSASGEWDSYNDQTDSFGFHNKAGTPEASITDNIGSYCLDTSAGDIYVKTTDSANTGWLRVPHESAVTSWTPNLTFGGGSTGMTYAIQQGYYVRQGNIVFVNMTVSLSAVGSSTGAALIDNLPFTISNSTNYYTQFTGEFGTFANLTAGYTAVFGRGVSNTTTMSFGQLNPTAASTFGLIQSNFTAGTQFIYDGFYFI